MITYRNWCSSTFVSFEETYWERLKNGLECICLSWGVKSGAVFVSRLIYPESACLWQALCLGSNLSRTMLIVRLWSGTTIGGGKQRFDWEKGLSHFKCGWVTVDMLWSRAGSDVALIRTFLQTVSLIDYMFIFGHMTRYNSCFQVWNFFSKFNKV